MNNYEYLCVFINRLSRGRTKALNRYSEQGYELVCVYGFWHYFRRAANKS